MYLVSFRESELMSDMSSEASLETPCVGFFPSPVAALCRSRVAHLYKEIAGSRPVQVSPVIKFPVDVGPQQLKLCMIFFRCRHVNVSGLGMLFNDHF